MSLINVDSFYTLQRSLDYCTLAKEISQFCTCLEEDGTRFELKETVSEYTRRARVWSTKSTTRKTRSLGRSLILVFWDLMLAWDVLIRCYLLLIVFIRRNSRMIWLARGYGIICSCRRIAEGVIVWIRGALRVLRRIHVFYWDDPVIQTRHL
ncbi:hypothetical protein BC829DRAFT_173041 [Chytridium lagenaria]|nr:hypothetical protein BC829DRAFT_173041 [Chytridium lagenaria]